MLLLCFACWCRRDVEGRRVGVLGGFGVCLVLSGMVDGRLCGVTARLTLDGLGFCSFFLEMVEFPSWSGTTCWCKC